MNKNRDMFIDLMEEIDCRHLETHIKKNTDVKSNKIKMYISAAGIYAAACVAVMLLIPTILNHTGNASQNSIPGAKPITTGSVAENDESIDKFFADTMLYKVLDVAGVKRNDVERLRVGKDQIVFGDVYYQHGNKIFRNKETCLLNEDSEVEDFRVGNGYIYYTVFRDKCEPSSTQKILYSYNMETKEKKIVCEEEILFFDFLDDEFIYVTGDSEALTEYKIYSYNLKTEKSELIYTIPSERKEVSSVYFNGDQLVVVLPGTADKKAYIKEYDVHNNGWKGLYSASNDVRFAFADSYGGYYFSCEWTRFEGDIAIDENVVKRHLDGVWYMNPDTEKLQKISSTPYDELYYVNGVLVGVNGKEVSVVEEKYTVEGNLFPRPESMNISYGWKNYSFESDDPLYEYLYEKINARVDNGSLTDLTGREQPSIKEYRENKVVRVEFNYYYDSKGAPIYPDKDNRDTAFAPSELTFPITGDNNDVVFFYERDKETGKLVMRCYGSLVEDPEIEAKILDYFNKAVTE